MAVVGSQERIDERVRQGGSLAQVEEEIIDSAPSGEEQKAALWLYASATIPRDLAEAVVETAKQPRPRLARLSSALRSVPSALSRTRGKVQRRAGEVDHGGA
jgi:cyanophycinase-like exopeptidase